VPNESDEDTKKERSYQDLVEKFHSGIHFDVTSTAVDVIVNDSLPQIHRHSGVKSDRRERERPKL
jgi:hypothetical protein